MIKENISQANRQDRGLCPMLAGLRNPTWDKNEDFWSVPRYWGHALHLYVHSLAPNNHDRDKIISALSSSAFFFFFFFQEKFPIIYRTRASQTQPQKWFLAHNMLPKCFQPRARAGNHSGGEGIHSFQEYRSQNAEDTLKPMLTLSYTRQAPHLDWGSGIQVKGNLHECVLRFFVNKWTFKFCILVEQCLWKLSCLI